MRTTLTLDDTLLAEAIEAMGHAERAAVIHEGLRLVVQRGAARRLAALGGSDPAAAAGARRRTAPLRKNAATLGRGKPA